MIASILEIIRGNELDRLLKKAAKDQKRRILIVWNRGLGDIALGLYALVLRIKEFMPEARLTFITRPELEDAFQLLDGVEVIAVPWWERGTPIDLVNTLGKLQISEDHYDMIIERVNTSKWLSWQMGKIIPKLTWKTEYDGLYRRFGFYSPSIRYIGVHLNTETEQFYGYKKDWPLDNWKILLEKLSELPNTKIILFGLNRTESFDLPGIVDMREKTTLQEMLSIIKNCCQILIAPDGGVLSIAYYLDVFFPIKVISLWGDANQGVLKQAVSSPNTGLVHVPLMGKEKDITKITVADVLEQMSDLSIWK